MADLGIGKLVDTARHAFFNFDKFSVFQRLTLVLLLMWMAWAVHWVWMPRLDCSLKIVQACDWIGQGY